MNHYVDSENIKHFPILDVESAADHYSKKDGVPVSYVCTTELYTADRPMDIFYRESPHPEFGNRYFGLFHSYETDDLMICNADKVEELVFSVVEDDENYLQYSGYVHQCKVFKNGNLIDGGRAYVRAAGKTRRYKVINGQFVEV